MPNASSPLPNPPRPLNNLRTIPHSGRDTLGVSWTARAGSASQQLDALLQTFSPKHAAMLSSGGLSSGGLQSTNSVPLLPTTTSLGGSLPDHPTPAVTSVAAAAAVALQNSIFNVGSAPQSPSFRAHLQTFDATVGSPVQGVGKAQGIGSAGTSGASSGNGNQVSLTWAAAQKLRSRGPLPLHHPTPMARLSACLFLQVFWSRYLTAAAIPFSPPACSSWRVPPPLWTPRS